MKLRVLKCAWCCDEPWHVAMGGDILAFCASWREAMDFVAEKVAL